MSQRVGTGRDEPNNMRVHTQTWMQPVSRDNGVVRAGPQELSDWVEGETQEKWRIAIIVSTMKR